ncbi:uncharacterized protein [Prorops nasuta]|uniref:uncharacterized protein n=1 Tax=Prorops nasuta TaxID=863751 RepID=UPI0034CDC98F
MKREIAHARSRGNPYRYLATGDSLHSLSYQYLIGVTTISNIIKETCETLWSLLHNEVMPSQNTESDWLQIYKKYEEKWILIIALVLLMCPPKAGSAYFNYKHSHSIVLLAICDANYKFLYVDIGAYGRRSDGGIFKDSLIGLKFRTNKMNLPSPQSLCPGGPPLPYILVGDEAFPLTHYLLRPYPGKLGLNDEQVIYNYRLSRARRTIENTFGILVSQWRILKRPINCSVKNTISIVKAVVCLHNYLRKDVQSHEDNGIMEIDCNNVSAKQNISDSALQNIGSSKALSHGSTKLIS